MQTSTITVSLDKSTLTKSLHGYSGAFLDFHIVSWGPPKPPSVPFLFGGGDKYMIMEEMFLLPAFGTK